MQESDQSPVTGIILKLISVVAFVGMGAFIKATAGHVPAGEQIFFRSAFAIPVVLLWLKMHHQLNSGVIRTAKPWGHLTRGLIGTLSMGLNFVALGLLPLPEQTAIGYTSPILVVVLAAIFLGEKVRLFRMSAVGCGMIGVLIVLYPNMDLGDTDTTKTIGALAGLGAATFGAVAQVYVRKLVIYDSPAAVVFWFTITSTVISLCTAPFGWIMPENDILIMLILAGLCGGIGQMFVTFSYLHTDASIIAPFDYASMILAIVIGYFVFGEIPTLLTLFGACIIIAAGIAIILRERHLGIKRNNSKPAQTPTV